MENQMTLESAKKALEKLYIDAGYTVPELLEYIEGLVKENLELTQELRSRRTAAARAQGRESLMSSKLYDALRE
ncbi:hypothetical protein [Paenibacillus protaetiae]|uniref:Uncharacterized protein n=1 Tax=Paenibacillus protaetiae TaxID=2509456 RepID=A0A4V0YET3_9BACL|nr:hypothetical protein [Paenibacillus protaetiae]QAY65311.1 hypothetical protein ET464_01860 [Paenibacillus protaetiae]